MRNFGQFEIWSVKVWSLTAGGIGLAISIAALITGSEQYSVIFMIPFLATAAGYTIKPGTTNSIKNTTRVEGYLQAGFTVSPMLTLQAIIGGATEDNDTYAKRDDKISYLVNAPITIAKNFTLIPEIAVFDELKDKNGVKQAKDIYYGAQWRVEF